MTPKLVNKSNQMNENKLFVFFFFSGHFTCNKVRILFQVLDLMQPLLLFVLPIEVSSKMTMPMVGISNWKYTDEKLRYCFLSGLLKMQNLP